MVCRSSILLSVFANVALICCATFQCRSQPTNEFKLEPGQSFYRFFSKNGPLTSKDSVAISFYIIGDNFLHRKQLDSSIIYFQKAIAVDQGQSEISAWSYGLIGQLSLKTSRRKEGVAALNRAVSLQKSYRSIGFALALLDSLNINSYDVKKVPLWTKIETPNILFLFQDTSRWGNFINVYIKEHEQAYEAISIICHAYLPKKLKMFVWRNRTLGERMLNRRLGFAKPNECRCDVYLSESIAHQMAHVLCFWIEGTPTKIDNQFISEGAAVAFDFRHDNKVVGAQRKISNGNIHSVVDIWENPKQFDKIVISSVGGAFFTYLLTRIPTKQLRLILKFQDVNNARKILGKTGFLSLVNDFDRKLHAE